MKINKKNKLEAYTTRNRNAGKRERNKSKIKDAKMRFLEEVLKGIVEKIC